MRDSDRNDLTTNVSAFCAHLRTQHGFHTGAAEAHDALRALEAIGITDEARFRSALRLVCCATRDETIVFDRAFAEFFRAAPSGAAQPFNAARHSRPGRARPERTDPRPPERQRPGVTPENEPESNGGAAALERPASAAEGDDANAWQTLRARYSPHAGSGQPPQLDSDTYGPMLVAASRLIASARLGRSRRWKVMDTGGRFDVRRTIRASLQTGGDPIELRYFGHPPRRPRFVVLIDGSRSMSEHTSAILQLARALCDRSARTAVFLFSSDLLDVTPELRKLDVDGGRLPDVGNAWGGGTRIGQNLASFVAQHGGRLLSPDTLVIIFSDGLDGGDIPLLEETMRTIEHRCAGIVWLNPHAAFPGYSPTARGMRAALPFITLLTAASDARGFEALALRLARHAKFQRRR